MQLHHFFEQSCDRYPANIALICDDNFLSYQELDGRSNQLAHYLLEQQITIGSIVGILIERSLECYVAILAVLKAGAAYVPIETEYPEERINYIFADLSFDLVLTSQQQLKEKRLSWPKHLDINQITPWVTKQPTIRPILPSASPDVNNLCYVIYTSGSTGKPKGVEITHGNISHYVAAASQIYQMTETDKVYQGFSLAFDASLEEVWMAFANGATLIACTTKEIRSGAGLMSFLQHYGVTVFSTVPTLLATLEGQLSDLRLLILGGETCPQSLVARWSRPGLRIMNTYGPTESTVIATYFECDPEKEVTIGQPVPGYEILILDESLSLVPDGQVGELCIGGPAVARGYVNKPENTAEKFIINPANSLQRLYRTGDLATKTKFGQFQYMGRADDQVKLRGFRIELNEIEAVILRYHGMKQAVVSLQTEDQPFLVAYVLVDQSIHFDVKKFKAFLHNMLPDYMVPAVIETVGAFPLLASGKINRKALPKPKQVPNSDLIYHPPQTDLERIVVGIWEKVLHRTKISIDADFFYDLGGHSLHAAQVVSNLRQLSVFKNISILDLYKNPTIRQVAKKFNDSSAGAAQDKPAFRDKYYVPRWKYILCGAAQLGGCVFQYAVGAWQLLAVILCYAWVTSNHAFVSTESQVAFLGLFLSMPLISLMITVSMKWLLLGRVKPGVYPLWGWFYFRWWLVQRLQKNAYLGGHFAGSPLINWYYRLLGAKIGKNCYIGTMKIATPDLFDMRDNSSIGLDSSLNGYVVEDGWLKIGTIQIGNNCYVGARSVVGLNTFIADRGVLDDMSMLADNTMISQDTYYVGSPASPSVHPATHITKDKTPIDKSSLLENTLLGILHYLGIVFVMLMYYLCILPGLALITYAIDKEYTPALLLAIPTAAILFLTLYYLSAILCKKIIMDRVSPGSYSLKSFYYFRHWVVEKMLAVDEIFIMADTLYFPFFLRFLGAKLGKNVEMGEVPHIIPDLVTIREGGFSASDVALAWPLIHQGMITFSPVNIGRRGFIGNGSLLNAGKAIGDEGLLGCLSVPPKNNESLEPHSAWLGSPAVFLPNRELFSGYSEQQTFTPPKKLYYMRLIIEFFRIILPTTFSFIIWFNLLYLLSFLLNNYAWYLAALLIPLAELFITLGLVAALVGLKWLLLGKLKSLTKPIWDPFIWKNDVIEYSFSYFTNPHYTNKVLGTPFAPLLFRCLGAKIGARVFTDSADFAEFDLINVGHDVCINTDAVIQTHLYEDRIFKASNIDIRSGCNIGVSSIILYNTLMEENAMLGNLSLLMKGECLPANTQWAGIPAQSVSTTISVCPVEEQSLEAIVGVQ